MLQIFLQTLKGIVEEIFIGGSFVTAKAKPNDIDMVIVIAKETNFDNISDTVIQQLEFWLNNRPRKCLNFLTPQEVFNSTVALAC